MSNHIKAEIVRLMREEFDPCPPNYRGYSWHDCAEEVADSIVALFASPQTDLVSRAEVLRVIRSLGEQDADLAMYGAADNARAREYGEAAATRACCAIALMPPASPSPAPAAHDEIKRLAGELGCEAKATTVLRAALDLAKRNAAPDGTVTLVPADTPAPAAVEELVARHLQSELAEAQSKIAHLTKQEIDIRTAYQTVRAENLHLARENKRLDREWEAARAALSTLAADKARIEAERDTLRRSHASAEQALLDVVAERDAALNAFASGAYHDACKGGGDIYQHSLALTVEKFRAAEARASALEGEVERLRAAETMRCLRIMREHFQAEHEAGGACIDDIEQAIEAAIRKETP